jgi:hypothetical protein
MRYAARQDSIHKPRPEPGTALRRAVRGESGI